MLKFEHNALSGLFSTCHNKKVNESALICDHDFHYKRIFETRRIEVESIVLMYSYCLGRILCPFRFSCRRTWVHSTTLNAISLVRPECLPWCFSYQYASTIENMANNSRVHKISNL